MAHIRARSRSTASRVGAQHADWLSLVEPTGQFLTVPVLKQAFPSGLPPVDLEVRRTTREWAAALDRDDPAEATAWIEHVLRDVLGWGPRLVTGPGVPDHLTHTVAEHAATLRPEYALLDGSGNPRVLVERYPHGTRLDARLPGDTWAATPIERTAALCRALGVPVGIATDSRYLVLVYAPIGAVGGHATWDTALFAEGAEATQLDALAAVTGAQRFFAVADGERLEDLLAQSADAQAELTGTLGLQVRRAVELLVAAISRANVDAEGRYLRDVPPQRVYEAAATTIMRLVFLLYAEERQLLPLGEELYDDNYAVSTLGQQLTDDSDRAGDEPLELRSTAWHRLLATFRAVYAGVSHDLLRLPAYGGSLFDPDRFPFLEGRAPGQTWTGDPSHPVPVDDLTVREILTALQWISTTEGGVTEARRLSFRALDVEQIGHVYEGTLDHSALVADTLTVGLVGKPGQEPEVAVADLEAKAAEGPDALVEYAVEQTGKTKRQVTALLGKDLDDDTRRRIRTAVDNDEALVARLEPFAHLLRDDLRGLPTVFIPGTIYVTETSHRRDTGTEYTPRELAEEIVTHALEPLVYSPGPAEGTDRADWKLKPSSEILALTVCDPAVGSGAILVAACRYLADRVVEAWTAEGDIPDGYTPNPTNTADEDELTVLARRAVADRCLFGVDRDPMAVEMAKLSLWLTTMSRERPFTFVDHAIRAGDSLLGITDLEQVTAFHMDPARGRALHKDLFVDLHAAIKPVIDEALDLRRQIAARPVITVRDVQRKDELNSRASAALAEATTLADLVVGAALVSEGKDQRLDQLLQSVQAKVSSALELSGEARSDAFVALGRQAQEWLNLGRPDAAPPRRPLHWPLAFPEVVVSGRFSAMVGNPPFQGGKKISGPNGTDYREYLTRWIAYGRKGNADLVTFFFLFAARVAEGFGFIATNTIAQGETREVGLDWLLGNGWTIPMANKSRPWPGSASLEIAQVWLRRQPWEGPSVLDGRSVESVTSTLDPIGRVSGVPKRLAANAGIAFIGSYVLGMGFTLPEEEARAMIAADPRNADVLFPYPNGQDLNTSPTHSASRWIINFFDWTEDKARTYAQPFSQIERLVKPERAQKDAKKYPKMVNEWWRYWNERPDLYAAIAGLDRVFGITLTSNTMQPAPIELPQVIDQTIVVFARDDSAFGGLIASSWHSEWVRKQSATLGKGQRYIQSDGFETFPFPSETAALDGPAEVLAKARGTVLARRYIGLTKAYNLVNDPDCIDEDVQVLREAHVALDVAVLAAYGWSDIEPDHGFYATAQGLRFTVGPAAREEMLGRLLELNHARYAEEEAAGLHTKGKKAAPRKRSAKQPPPDDQLSMI